MFLENYRIFEKMGARLFVAPNFFVEKCKTINTLVFDWDGVFHSGKKHNKNISSFSEIDSMGINMLRFGYYLLHGRIPKTYIITGENNPTAHYFAQREHFDAVFYGIKNKIQIGKYLENKNNTSLSKFLFLFDDILDLSLAEQCGIRLMANTSSAPLLKQFAIKHNYTDYLATYCGDNGVVRECSELILDAIGKFEQTLNNRIAYSSEYNKYLIQRNNIPTISFTSSEGEIISQDYKE